MIIYEKQTLENLQLQQDLKAEKIYTGLSHTELETIEKAYPVNLYSPNVFVRIGLFLLSTTILSCTSGLMFLIFEGLLTEYTIALVLLIFGGLTYVALEVICKNNRHFGAGTDDALSIFSLLLLISGMTCLKIFIFKQDINTQLFLEISVYTMLLSLWYTLRFANRLQATLTYLALLSTILLSVSLLTKSTLALHIAALLIGIAAYYLCSGTHKTKQINSYRSCLQTLQYLSLISIGISCNYYCVDALGSEIGDGQFEVPFPILFWIWTFIFPICCILYGLKKHNRILLRSGLILSALAVLSIFAVNPRIPAENLMSISGAILLVVSWRMLIWLRTPRYGLLKKAPFQEEEQEESALSSVIISASIHQAPEARTARFGGGNFGGGGSSSDF